VKFYTRVEIQQLLEIDDGLWLALESEEVLVGDAPSPGCYSERMLERARVARNLMEELDVNLAGAAIIVRMREGMAALRHDLERTLGELGSRGARGPNG
jgi:hypothetical protein